MDKLSHRFLSMDLPMADKIALIWQAVPPASEIQEVRDIGESRLGLRGAALEDWARRAWWGMAAGEIVRAHLFDENQWHAVMELIDPPDLQEMHRLHQQGGLILATAHLGPPKTGMAWLVANLGQLAIWTNINDMPDWVTAHTHAKLMNPLDQSRQAALLIQSALHLRNGGLLFGAPDVPSGGSLVTFDGFGQNWRLSQGLPALIYKLHLPSLLMMALWHGERIRLVSIPIEPPDFGLPMEEWNRQWLVRYWHEVKAVIHTSPENLRFLRSLHAGKLLAKLNL